jgi:hypothetical protein
VVVVGAGGGFEVDDVGVDVGDPRADSASMPLRSSTCMVSRTV